MMMALPYFQPWFGWSCSGSTKGRFFFCGRSQKKRYFFSKHAAACARTVQPMITQSVGISWFMRWSPLALLVHTVIHAQTGHERMVRKTNKKRRGGEKQKRVLAPSAPPCEFTVCPLRVCHGVFSRCKQCSAICLGQIAAVSLL